MARKVTLRDVAELANVAIGTASQALSQKDGVLPTTRQRVIDAAMQLGYDKRFVVPEEPHTDLKTICVLKHEIYDRPGLDPFYMPMIAGIEQECQKHGFLLFYATVEVNQLIKVVRLPTTIQRVKLDGLICVGTHFDRGFTQEMLSMKCPVVLVDGFSYDDQYDSIRINNVDGAYRAVSYLIDNGHRRIGLIGSCADTFPDLLERREGYLRALREHDISESYVIEGLIYREAAHNATAELLKNHPEVTAIFACNDNAAIGAMKCARGLGVNVPDDLSIVGFDDIAFAQDLLPPLTTMHVDKLLMGSLAVRQLLFRAEHLSLPVISTVVRTSLVERKSVKNIS